MGVQHQSFVFSLFLGLALVLTGVVQGATSSDLAALKQQYQVTGSLKQAIADGAGGYYIGGSFHSVNGVRRNNIAHVLPNIGVDMEWNPDANGAVDSLILQGNTLFVTGQFTQISGRKRVGLAALNATSGQATGWNPNSNGTVWAIAVSGATVFVGGTFTNIGSLPRANLAALDANTGLATGWNPGANNNVYALAVRGNTVYVGGQFTRIGGLNRNYLAAVDATTGIVTGWNPNPSDFIEDLALRGNRLYAVGWFTTIGGQSRNYIAELDSATAQATAWNPNASRFVENIAVNGTTIYVGGGFTSIGGAARNYIAALDATTGMAKPWNPNSNNLVFTVAVAGNTVFAGGDFTSMGGQPRNRIAAIDATTGQATSWNPNATAIIRIIGVHGNRVYVGGDFTQLGGQARNRFAAFDISSGQLTGWNPNPNSWVEAIAFSDTLVYAGGDFSNIGGQVRNRVAAVVADACAPTFVPDISPAGTINLCAGSSTTLTAPAGYSYLWSTGETSQSVSITAAGIYTVQVIVGACTSTASTPVVVTTAPPPSAPAVVASGPLSFCQGGTVTLSAPAGLRYRWSNGDTTQSITADTSGNYSVFTISNGCTSAVSAPQVVTVLAVPATPQIIAAGATSICAGSSVTLSAPAGLRYRWSNGDTTQTTTVSTAGSYTVFTIANGCSSAVSNPVTVNIIPLPTTPTIVATGTTSICRGKSVTLSAPAGLRYRWSNGDTTQTTTVSTAGSYTVFTIANGCSSAISAPQQVSIIPGPTAGIVALSDTMVAFPSGATYQWLFNGQPLVGRTGQGLRAQVSGPYQVIVTQNGCSDTSAVTIITSLHSNLPAGQLVLFPNPSTSTLQLTLSSGTISQVQVLDQLGRMLITTTELPDNKLDVSSLAAGTYVVRVVSDSGVVNRTVSVVR